MSIYVRKILSLGARPIALPKILRASFISFYRISNLAAKTHNYAKNIITIIIITNFITSLFFIIINST